MTEEEIDAVASRHPGDAGVAGLAEEIRTLRRAYDALRESVSHLIDIGVIRREDAAKTLHFNEFPDVNLTPPRT